MPLSTKAIVSQIIRDHRGYIRVRNNLPRGTVFVIELPVAGEKTPDLTVGGNVRSIG